MPNWVLLLSFLFLAGDPVQTWKCPEAVEDFSLNQQGDVFIVKGHEIVKYKGLKEQYRYSNKRLGEITYIDAANSLRLLVYYRDLNQVVILDNTLSLHGETIDMNDVDFEQITLAAYSNNNTLWLYDQQRFELVRTDRQLNVLSRSGNLGQLLDLELDPNLLFESGDNVYLNDPNHGVLIFDQFGTYYKTHPVKGLTDMQATAEGLVYAQNDSLYFHDFVSFNTSSMPIPGKGAEKVRVDKNHFYVLYPDSLVRFKY